MKMIPLIEVLEKIPDNRSRQGRRYSLESILAACVVAMLCGYSSYSAIAEWCQNYGCRLLSCLGFQKTSPCAATFYNVLKTLDVKVLEQSIGQWFQQNFLRDEAALAIDGKSLRGTKKQGSELYHLISAVSSHLGITAYQWNVGEKTGEIKGFEKLLQGLLLEGKILTMDALLTQRKIAQRIVKSHCAYVMTVKDNQEYLKEDIAALLFFKEKIGEIQTYTCHDKGHGRIERRSIQLCQAEDYIDWPGVKQIFSIEREIWQKGKTSLQKVYGLTSLSAEEADTQMLLNLNRGHWSVENKSHWVRDVVYREDHSQVRVGRLPQVMAALRNLAIGLIKAADWKSVTKANRFYTANPALSIELVLQRIK